MGRAHVLFGVSIVPLAALFVWAATGLPAFGEEVPALGDQMLDFVVREVHATNAVGAITYEVRGFDTLVEEFILFSAAAGLAMLLRRFPFEREESATEDVTGRESPDVSDAIRLSGYAVAGITVLVGLYVVAYGALTPGGGFQGGVVLASALFMVFLASEYRTMRRVRPGRLVDAAEAVGAAAIVLLALAGMVLADTFFENYLPRGETGRILGGGLALAVNYAAGFAVAAAFTSMVSEFLEQTLVVRGKDK